MEMSGQLHDPALLYPGKRVPSTRWIGGWVGPRAVPDTEVESCVFKEVAEGGSDVKGG